MENTTSFDRYKDARYRLDEGLIRPELTCKEPERTMEKWTARIAEMVDFLNACGNPQKAFPTIHVTGTSGKGSVCAYLAHALHRGGYKVGLHISPFLQSPTEKIWISGELVSADDFSDLVDWVWPLAIPRKKPQTPASIHGMASVAIAYEAFRRAEVDVVVLEAGCGGRFDLTNTVEPIATVVTNVGMDHVLSLGPTVEDIAWHKAGILKPGIPAVTGAHGEPLNIIRNEAQSLGVHLIELEPCGDRFWETNQAMASQVLKLLVDRFDVAEDAIQSAYAEATLPARREIMPEPGHTVILDGAHNPDKMSALARTLVPGCVVVLGCLQAKAFDGLVQALKPVADKVITTEPSVYAKPATTAQDLADHCKKAGIQETYAVPDPAAALDKALELSKGAKPVVATGSLYLVGEIRERWYPIEQVVLQRTSWPRTPDPG